jgi:hypothetical protein
LELVLLMVVVEVQMDHLDTLIFMELKAVTDIQAVFLVLLEVLDTALAVDQLLDMALAVRAVEVLV